jgi:hypothetical protein
VTATWPRTALELHVRTSNGTTRAFWLDAKVTGSGSRWSAMRNAGTGDVVSTQRARTCGR